MRLTKHHGLGNDFLVALAADNDGAIEPDDRVSIHLCDRRRGIGADGLLWGLPPRNPAGAELRMVLHNSDGSEAEISGNGIRCLAQAALRLDGLDAGTLRVETAAGLRTVEVTRGDRVDTIVASVDMGAVTDGPPLPPAVTEWGAHHVASLTIGNPHLVLHVDSLESIRAEIDGAALQSMVPGSINVHFLTVTDSGRIELVHFERGAGVTEACGSGASAAAVAAVQWELTGPTVAVGMPGGDAVVTVSHHDGEFSASLRGPAQFVGEVIVP